MIEVGRALKIGMFNVSGLTNRLPAVDEIEEGTVIFELCETWIKRRDDPARLTLDEAVDAPSVTQPGRG